MRKALPFLLALGLSTACLADHTITMRTTMNDPSAQGMKMTNVTRTKDKRQRIEDTTETSGFKMVQTRLIMCDLEKEAQIDPENKIYTARSLNPVTSLNPTGKGDEKVTKGTGKVTTTVKVQDKGMEKIAQLDAHHWIVDTQSKGEGCIGTFNYNSTREFWTSNLPSFSCPVLNGTWKNQSINGCVVSNVFAGDVDLFWQSMSKAVVKEIFYVNGKPSMTRELVDFSTAELDPSLFSLDGYKEVSESEFQQAQQQKMMKMYQQGH